MKNRRKVLIEYLYLDLQTCDRCVGTDKVLSEVLEVLEPALQLAGYEVESRKVEMSTPEIAAAYRFLSSPTIRVNGRDICLSVEENDCGCCSEIAGSRVECRVFRYEDQIYEVPPKELLAYSILKAIFSARDDGVDTEYIMPENLKTFYANKANKECSSCCPSGGCC